MTKKDYIVIELAIKEAMSLSKITSAEKRGVTLTIEFLSDYLKSDNPKFNAEKFAEACGLPREKQNISKVLQEDNWMTCGCLRGYPHISRCIHSEFSKKH